MLISDLSDYSDAYIVVTGRIIAAGNDNASRRNRKLIFKYNALFGSCITKVNNTFVDNVEYIVMPMYNLLEHSDNYSMTSGSYYRKLLQR